MFITVKIRSLVKPAIAVATVVLFASIVFFAFSGKSVGVLGPYNCQMLLIDAGHGGVDGGAISAEGVKESDVNLAIALRMSRLCDLVGIGHQLTRGSDVGCLESESYSEHDDLVARAQMANSIPECVLISVHQNKYPSEIVRGAEIMYAETPGSKELGVITQSNMVLVLDPENRRVAHSAPSQLLLTSSVNCPAILAECGFMSNPQEAGLLADGNYQTKIAMTLIASYIQFSCRQL